MATAIKIEIIRADPQHTVVRVFDGPDMDHLASCGQIVMSADGASRLVAALVREAISATSLSRQTGRCRLMPEAMAARFQVEES